MTNHQTESTIVSKNDDKLIAVAKGKIVDLFLTPTGIAHATVNNEGRHDTFPVDSVLFREFLTCSIWQETKNIVPERKLEDLIRILRVEARLSKKINDVYIRVASVDGGIEIDLNNNLGECIFVTPLSYRVTYPKAKFIRPKNLATLPTPEEGGDIELFKKHFSVGSENDLKLIIGFSLFTLSPTGPYPILNFKGPQGSGKSTAMTLLKKITDPEKSSGKRSEPKTVQQLFVSAKHTHVLTYDNISSIRADISDGLCMLSTGGTFSSRMLYTNDDENNIDRRLPVIINGIPSVASKSDLISRCVIIDLLPICVEKDEREIYEAFTRDHPYLLGYLCKGLAYALANLSSVSPIKGVRLQDFVKFVTAAEDGLGWERGSFKNALISNQGSSLEEAIAMNPVVCAIKGLLMSSSTNSEWIGTAEELRIALREYCDDDVHYSKAWPKTAANLSKEMARLQQDLPRVGIEFSKFDRKGNWKGLRLKLIQTDLMTPQTLQTKPRVRDIFDD